MSEGKGHFVVLEGIDGAGTTTQVARLVDRLRAASVRVRATREPSDGPVGMLLRQALAGRLIVPGGKAPGWATMALLFAADRMDHVESEIGPFVDQGGVVVSDRYDASSLAYQSLSSGGNGAEAIAWIRSINQHARRPDLTVVLDIPPEVAAERRGRRGEAAQIYDDHGLQSALALFYRGLPAHMPRDRVALIDATGTVETVEERVWDAYQHSFLP